MYRSTFSRPRQWLELSGQLHAPAAFSPGKEPQLPIGCMLGGPRSWSEPYGEVNIFNPIGARTPTGGPNIVR
jgi:hypothetical protein